MNQNIFNLRRFKNLFVRDIFVNLRSILSVTVGIFLILSLILYLVLLGNKNSAFIFSFVEVNYLLSFIIGIIIVSGNAFKDLRNKEAKMSYLMLPSTSLEKFLSQYLVVTVVFTIIHLASYLTFGLLNTIIINSFSDNSVSLSLWFGWEDLKFLRALIPIQLLLLAGTVTFRKSPRFYTGLVFFVYTLVLSFIFAGIIESIFTDTASNFTTGNALILNINHPKDLLSVSVSDFSYWSSKALYLYYQYGLSILAFMYILFKIKEKEA